MINIARKSVSRFAHDVAIRLDGGDISSFIVPSDTTVASVAEEVCSALEQFTRGRRVELVSVTTARDLLERLPTGDAILVAAIDRWSTKEWRHLDLHRDRLAQCAIVLVMSDSSLKLMISEAPHLYSFVDEPIHEGEDEALLSDEERRQRIAALETRMGFSSDELIARAQAGETFVEPEYGEWLLLLGRGDLL